MNAHLPERKNIFPLPWILLLALLMRLTLALTVLQHPERAYQNDTPSYIEFAKAILSGHGWGYPSAFRTPGYPLFLAGIMSLFGERTLPLVIAQVLISAASVGVTYKLGQGLFDERIAVFAALFLAFNIESITHSFYLLSETLFTLLFVLSAYFLFRARSKDSRKYLILSGVFLGFSILTRPVASYYPLFALLLLFWNDTPLKTRVVNSFVFLLSCGLIVVPWVARNGSVLGLPVVSSISDYNLLYYNAASLLESYGENDVRTELENRVEKILVERGLPDTEAHRTRISGEMGKQIILADPFSYTVLHLKSDINGLNPDDSLPIILGINTTESPLEILKQQGLIAAIQNIRYDYRANPWILVVHLLFTLLVIFCYLGWGIATLQLFRERKLYTLVFLSLPIFYSLLLPGAVSYSRFRVPVMPFICILAAVGLVFLGNWSRKLQIYKKFIHTNSISF